MQGFTAQDGTEQEALQLAVISALLTLPDDQLLVLYHRYYNRLTLSNTAAIMGWNVERTRKVEAKALRALRQPDIFEILKVFV